MFDPAWEEIFQSQEWGKYPPESVIRFVARNWYKSERKSIRLLDIGCGPGACTWYMAREGFSVSGIDGSPTAIRRAAERLASEGLRTDLRMGDFTKELPWDDAAFDGVIDNAALCANSLADWCAALGEIRRVLKPGGKLFSVCFSDECSRINIPAYVGYVSERDVRDLYAGFSLEIDRYTHAIAGQYTSIFAITATR